MRVVVKEDNASLARIEEKCINCGVCQKTCLENNNIGDNCINCGQCILTCPTGALVPKYVYQKVLNYINDTDYTVVVLTSPAVRVAIGDEFGFEAGAFLEGKMVGALKKLGFDYVFDTTFGADLTVMEEASELVSRLAKKQTLFTSCCPAWVSFMALKHPEDLDYLSTSKSPIAMLGAMVKTYFADFSNLNKEKIITVALAPCVAKKYEMKFNDDVDFVITTRELAMMMRECGIDFPNCIDQEFDKLLGTGSGAGLIFGSSGGVMEATLRTAYYMLNKEKAPDKFYELAEVRGQADFKETIVDMKGQKLKVAVLNKVANVEKYYSQLKNYDFVEVMACPTGCVGGGGQPLVASSQAALYQAKRQQSLYASDKENKLKESYANKDLQVAYSTYINKNKVNLHREKEKIPR